MVLNADAYVVQQLPYSNLGRVNVKGGHPRFFTRSMSTGGNLTIGRCSRSCLISTDHTLNVPFCIVNHLYA